MFGGRLTGSAYRFSDWSNRCFNWANRFSDRANRFVISKLILHILKTWWVLENALVFIQVINFFKKLNCPFNVERLVVWSVLLFCQVLFYQRYPHICTYLYLLYFTLIHFMQVNTGTHTYKQVHPVVMYPKLQMFVKRNKTDCPSHTYPEDPKFKNKWTNPSLSQPRSVIMMLFVHYLPSLLCTIFLRCWSTLTVYS